MIYRPTITLDDMRRAGACDSGLRAALERLDVLPTAVDADRALAIAGPGNRDIVLAACDGDGYGYGYGDGDGDGGYGYGDGYGG